MSTDLSEFGGGIRISERLRPLPEHLQTGQPEAAELPAETTNSECYCSECLNRVTVGPGGDEYGHELACEWSCYERRQA
jgi:hypothetical protein